MSTLMNPAVDSIITVRRVTPEDRDFLFGLYCAARAEDFSLLALPKDQKQQLILMQFTAQQNAYRAQFPGSDYVIVMQNDRPVGRIWIAEMEQEFHLVDIALLPEARRAGKTVRSTVFRFNSGSLRFHERLGFRISAEDPVQYYMEWRPGDSP